MEEQLYPIGQQCFEDIIKEGRVYVDKTSIIYNLTYKFEYVFLARPRRFGKSLLLSTIQAYFEGKKELFEGLAIYDIEKDWKKYPVLHLDLSDINPDNSNSLELALEEQLKKWEEEYGVINKGMAFAQRFSSIIKGAYKKTGEKVVVLVDECDNPQKDTLQYPEFHDNYRSLLTSLYINFKSHDKYIRFAMITGVRKSMKNSIFGGANNILDISLSDDYAAICGFTLDEIKKYMWPGIVNLAEKQRMTAEEALEALKSRYDGYHFSEECPDIYNPFSLLNALSTGNIGDYWISSGIPDYLVRKLEDSDKKFVEIFNAQQFGIALTDNEGMWFSLDALMYQTGYLTIKSYEGEYDLYELGIPNKEVNIGLFSKMLSYFARKDGREISNTATALKKSLQNGNPNEFLERLKSFFAGIPFSLNPDRYELNFEKVLYSILRLLDLDVRSEVQTSDGRIDVLIKTDEYIYVMELKLDKPAREALEQIDNKSYPLQFRYDDKKIFKIGISYSSETRNISAWEIENF